MKNRLLNFSKNLIISLGLIVLIMVLFFTTSSYAEAGDTFGKIMRTNISSWYKIILNFSLSVYFIGYLVIVLKLLADRTPQRMKTLKESIGRFILMFAVIYFLHYIMIAILLLNERGIGVAKSVGTMFSGIDMQNDEYDLYETVLSKAYELSSVPGTIGLIMYALLVYYTCKFVFVYARRFINIIILILLAPIIFVVSTIKKIITGSNDGRITRWFKEFIFNVIIQTFHAIFYAILIGYTLKMSDDNENLIGALLTLILFGFIFKIDSIIRKVFNFVGGSTKINSSKSVRAVIDTVGGAVNTGLDAANAGLSGGKNVSFGEDIKAQSGTDTPALNSGESGELTQPQSQGLLENIKLKFKQLPNETAESPDSLNTNAQGRLLGGVAEGMANAYANAKAEIGDINEVLNGERVKDKLTADEIVEQMHKMEDAEGLEGLRQRIQGIGHTALKFPRKISKKYKELSMYTNQQIGKVKENVKRGIADAKKEFNKDVENLETDIEMVKRIPRIMRFYTKVQNVVNNAEEMDFDLSNILMLTSNTSINPEQMIKNLQLDYGEIDISGFVLENIGAQAFLSPAVGSVRMGLAMLAEYRYEKKAEHKIEELLTGRKHKKRRVKANALMSISAQRAGKPQKADNKKVYRFSRFSPNSAKNITNRVLKRIRRKNKYLLSIGKASNLVKINNMSVSGSIAPKTTAYLMKAKRDASIKSIRQIKLGQQAALSNYRSVVRKARHVEKGNRVANQVLNAKKVVKLGFKQIDNMSSGQIALRKMFETGIAKELSNGLIVIKENGRYKIKATGAVSQKDEEEIIQFVLTQSGNLEKQIVSADGKIIKPAINKDGEIVFDRITQEGEVVTEEKEQTRKSILEILHDSIRYGSTNPESRHTVEMSPEEKLNVATNISSKISPNVASADQSEGPNLSQNVEKVKIGAPVEHDDTVRNTSKTEDIDRTSYTSRMETISDVKNASRAETTSKKESRKSIIGILYDSIKYGSTNPKKRHTVTVDRLEHIGVDFATQGEKETEKIQKLEAVVSFQNRKANAEGIISSYNEDRVLVSDDYSSELAHIDQIVDNIESSSNDEESGEIVQHVVTLDGKIVEQMIRTDGTIDTEGYQIVGDADEDLFVHVQDLLTNEDLGLEEDATVDERIEKFQVLLDDVQRDTDTQALLEQVVDGASAEERELDEILVGAMEESGVSTMSELRQIRFGEDIGEEELQKREDFEKSVTDRMVVSGFITQEEAEDEDIVGKALEVLNSRVDELTTTDNSILFNVAAELERTRIADELMQTDEFTEENPPTDMDIDERVENLSSLLVGLAQEKVEETTRFPREVLEDTREAMEEVIENASEKVKTEEEKQFEKELEKAEKKWAKRNEQEKDKQIVDKYKKQENGEENQIIKITLKFFGAVERQGQSITLNNRSSIKDFYDKAKKVDGANLEKTQKRFLQVYGSKLSQMQLLPFTFSKHPVADMDGWAIYVVNDKEDVEKGEKENVKEKKEDVQEVSPETARALVDKYFMDIKEIFIEFIEKHNISAFDQILEDPFVSQKFVKRMRVFLFRHGEKEEQEKAVSIMKRLRDDYRFRDLLQNNVRNRNAKQVAKDAVKNAKDNIRIVNKKGAEELAENVVTPEEVNEFKVDEKAELMDQVLDEVMIQQEEEAASDQELNDLLNQIKENKVYVMNTDNESGNRFKRELQYDTKKE